MNDDEKIQRMANLSYVLGLLEMLQDLPRGRHAMAWYSITCHNDESPDGDLCIEADTYNEILEKKLFEVEKQQKEIWEEVKHIDTDLLKHINTLYISLGYTRIFNNTINRMLYILQGSFIDMHADNKELVRGRALSIFENIVHQIEEYQKLIDDLQKNAEIKLNKALAAVSE